MKTITYILTLAILMMFASPILAAQNEPTTVNPMYRQMEKMQLQIKEVKATKEPEKRKMLMQQHMQSMREGMMMMDETSYANGMMMRETGYTNGMMMGETDDAHGMMMGEAQSKVVHQRMQENQERIPCQQNDIPCQRIQTMEHRQESMQERMKMMQMIMQQMMEHQSAQTDLQ